MTDLGRHNKLHYVAWFGWVDGKWVHLTTELVSCVAVRDFTEPNKIMEDYPVEIKLDMGFIVATSQIQNG